LTQREAVLPAGYLAALIIIGPSMALFAYPTDKMGTSAESGGVAPEIESCLPLDGI
jgi:hypothetical protein